MNTPVSFETAKLIKEKGFGLNEDDYTQLPRFYEVDGNYTEYDVHVGKKHNPHLLTHLGADTISDFEAHLTMMDNSLDGIYLAPNIAEVVMWLCEKQIDLCHMVDYKKETKSYRMGIVYIEDNKVQSKFLRPSSTKFEFIEFPSISEAYEAGIEYCLTKII